MRLSWFK